jgi:hypothetical protein
MGDPFTLPLCRVLAAQLARGLGERFILVEDALTVGFDLGDADGLGLGLKGGPFVLLLDVIVG